MAYIGRQNLGGAYRQLDDISSGFDGSDTTHTMQVNSQNVTVGDVNQIILSLGGVIQKPGTDFTVSGSVLTFTTAPAANTSFFAILLGSDNGGTVTPTDDSVTTDKIAADQITKAKLADSVDIFAGTSLSAADLGGGIHIKSADSGASANASHDEIVIEGSGNSGLSILSGNTSNGAICFGDDGNNSISYIDYDHNTNAMQIGVNNAAVMDISSAGEITKPLQPAFRVTPATMDNLDINQYHTLQFNDDSSTGRFDVNADFNTSTYTFTAPVTGKYVLCAAVLFQAVDGSSGDYLGVRLETSNHSMWSHLFTVSAFDSDPNYYPVQIANVYEMDANDTAYVRFYINLSLIHI